MKCKLLIMSICIILLFFASCADKVKDLQTETDKLAGEINAVLVETREIGETLVNDVRDLIVKAETYDGPVNDLDVNNGGNLKLTQGYYIAQKDTGRGVLIGWNYFTDMNTMPTDNILKEMKLVDTILADKFIKLKNDKYFLGTLNLYHYADDFLVTLNFPFFDVLSTLPAKDILIKAIGGSARNVPYFSKMNIKNNPEKNIIWEKELYVHAAAAGIFLNISLPVYMNETDKDVTAVIALHVDIQALNKNIVADKAGIYIITTTTGNVFASSKIAKDIFGINLPYYDYLAQFASGKKIEIGDKFKLTSYDDPGLKELGNIVSSEEKEFKVKIKGILYSVIVSDIPEINAKAIGLVK